MTAKMTRYKQAELMDDNTSIGSVQLTGGVSATTTHIRYHSVSGSRARNWLRSCCAGRPHIRMPADVQGWTIWRSRSGLERGLLVLTAFLLVLVFVLITCLGVMDYGERPKEILHVSPAQDGGETTSKFYPNSPGPPVCLSQACVSVAASIINSMDPKVNPCEDFYQYACGGWIRNNPIPDGKSLWSNFGKIEMQNKLVIKNALEKPFSEMKSKAETKAKSYYISCMDLNGTTEEKGGKPLLELIGKVGGWNITTPNWKPENFSLQRVLTHLHNKLNMGGLFAWAVGEDDKNSSRYIIQIDQGGLFLPTRENYLNKTENAKILSAYLDYMTKIGVLLGGEENSTRSQMAAVIEFETRLADITVPQELKRDEEQQYHLLTISELQELAPFINWQTYFNVAMNQVNKTITANEQVVVYGPDYLSNLTQIIKEYTSDEEGKITLNNYLVWQTVQALTQFLSKAYREAYKGLRKALLGSEGSEESWRYCVSDTNSAIGYAIGAMFVREMFQQDSKETAQDMINQIKMAFKKNLKNLSWMDKKTIAAAEKKADAMTDMIGYPDCINNKAEIEEKYKDLSINESDYFTNNIRVNKYNLKKNLENLGKEVNRTRWSMLPSTVNAYYTPTKNQMVFPAGILQPPFFDPRHPWSLNFGAIGVVMGHELTHAFDDQGRVYDLNGNLHQWWNNKTIDKFKKRTDCVVNQYSNYSINGKNINGKQTLGENIADNGGLKAAFHAYKERTKTPEPPLPGLNFTHKQLFFISFAQVWCSASTNEATTLQLEKDSHSPAQFRVNGALANLEEFSQEFQCHQKSMMNPKNKCELW